MNIHIQNARVIDPASGLDQCLDVYVKQGIIVGIGQAPSGFIATTHIDATGKTLIPGLVDLAARLREPGLEYRATLASELQAAVAGGVTSLACPPDTDPPLDEPGLVQMLKHRARLLNLAHVYPVGALTQNLQGEKISELAELSEAGCVAFSQAALPIHDHRVLFRAFQYAATFGFSVWLRPQDATLARDGVAHDGQTATRLGLNAIPVAAETLAIYTILTLAQEAGVRVHLCRLSSAKGVQMVREAKAQGLPISCDVAVHHLHLTDVDMGFFDSAYHVKPPFRGEEDRQALWQGLQDGTIDAICSDHTPVDEDCKLVPFAESEAGATALELLLPLTLQWANQHNISLAQALKAVTSAPAALLGISAGRIALGAPADLCLVDLDAIWQVSAKTLKSQGHNTPYLGKPLIGRVHTTIVNGQIVFQLD